MPPVKFYACLDLDQICLFLDGHKFGNVDYKLGVVMLIGTMTGIECGAQIVMWLERLGQVGKVVRWVYVVFLLLIFFMLSSSFVFNPGIKVNLPESVASENQERLNSMIHAANAIKESQQQMRLELNALRQKEITQELLEIAISAEKNSVLFYVGLKDLVTARAGRDKVETIIREQVKHVADLRRQLTSLTA